MAEFYAVVLLGRGVVLRLGLGLGLGLLLSSGWAELFDETGGRLHVCDQHDGSCNTPVDGRGTQTDHASLRGIDGIAYPHVVHLQFCSTLLLEF